MLICPSPDRPAPFIKCSCCIQFSANANSPSFSSLSRQQTIIFIFNFNASKMNRRRKQRTKRKTMKKTNEKKIMDFSLWLFSFSELCAARKLALRRLIATVFASFWIERHYYCFISFRFDVCLLFASISCLFFFFFLFSIRPIVLLISRQRRHVSCTKFVFNFALIKISQRDNHVR